MTHLMSFLIVSLFSYVGYRLNPQNWYEIVFFKKSFDNTLTNIFAYSMGIFMWLYYLLGLYHLIMFIQSL
jgi:hypothetical protein